MKPGMSSAFERRIYHQDPPRESPPRRSVPRGANLILSRLERRFRRDGRLISRPSVLVVDPTSRCNLRCPLCPTGRGTLAREAGFLSPEPFRALMADLGRFLRTITFTNWGEPLLHPRLPELLRIARRSPAYIGFSTNLQVLEPEQAEGLIRSGIDEIAVSIDGVTQEVYQRYRRGGSLEKVLRNLERLLELRSRLAPVTGGPRIRWQYLIHSGNEHEMDDAARMAEQMGVDAILFAPIYVDIEGMFVRPVEERLAREGEWLPSDESLHVYDLRRGRMRRSRRTCRLPWEMLVLNWDGSVSPCCGVVDRRDDFGNVFREGLQAVWNGSRYRAARRLLARGEAPEERLVCSFCAEHGTVYY